MDFGSLLSKSIVFLLSQVYTDIIYLMKPDTSVFLINVNTGYRKKDKTSIIGENLNANLIEGELTCLLGPNGAGKSTLLRTLSAFLPPISGEIQFYGRPLSDYTTNELSRLIGVVLTDRLDVRDMPVSDLVALGRSPYTGFFGKLNHKDREIVQEALMMTGTVALADRMVHTLSDGERQKVLIAKTLAQQTPIILLDEPTAFLDYPSKVELMHLLRNLARKTRKTIFLSTHDLELALQVADRIWLIDKEKGLTTGIPEDLALNGLLSKYFERDGIFFSIETGLFQVKEQTEKDIPATGPEHIVRLVSKSFARHGIRIVPVEKENNPDVFPQIIIRPDKEKEFCFEYFWHPDNQTKQVYSSIETLTAAVINSEGKNESGI